MSKTLDHVKYGTRMAASATFSFLKINLLGALSTGLSVFAIIMLIIYQSLDGPSAGHAGGAAALIVLFSVRPIAFVMGTIILFASPFLLFALGNKYIVMRASSKVLKDKGENILYPLLDKALITIKVGGPEVLRKGGDTVKMRLRLMQAINESGENKWMKRITTWGLKKADLSNVDFGAEDLSITQVVRERVVAALHAFATPSRTFFWVILAVQWSVVVLTALQVI